MIKSFFLLVNQAGTEEYKYHFPQICRRNDHISLFIMKIRFQSLSRICSLSSVLYFSYLCCFCYVKWSTFAWARCFISLICAVYALFLLFVLFMLNEVPLLIFCIFFTNKNQLEEVVGAKFHHLTNYFKITFIKNLRCFNFICNMEGISFEMNRSF